MAVNLTTRYLFKVFAGLSLTDTSDDTRIDSIIQSVSQAIENECGRAFTLTTYRLWLDGTGTQFLVLPNWPITKMYGCSLSTRDVGEITFSGGTRADVSFDGSTLTLHSRASDGSEDETELTVNTTTNAIISTLATNVTAETGWTMTTRSGETTQPSDLIRPIDGEYAVSPDKVDLEVPDESDNVRVTQQSNQLLQREGALTFPAGRCNVFVWYKAGYTLPSPLGSNSAPTTAGNVPDDLEMICNEACKRALDWSNSSGNITSERIGNYQYQKSVTMETAIINIVADFRDALTPHKTMAAVL